METSPWLGSPRNPALELLVGLQGMSLGQEVWATRIDSSGRQRPRRPHRQHFIPSFLPMSVLREEILAFRRENCHPQALKNQERIGGGEEGKREGEKGEKGGTMGRPGGKT